jgi:glycosyltransferase involved in cell wall biosynthesis
LLREKFPNAISLYWFAISGMKRTLKIVDRSINGTEYVLYTCDVDDVKAAIASLAVFVLSSVQPEPFAGVVIEAMALKRPVVATAIGGSLEQVVNGVTGYLVEPGDPDTMADAIRKLLEAPAQARGFGRNGQERFLDKFEFELFYRRILPVDGL